MSDIRDAMREGRERHAHEHERAAETPEARAERRDRERDARVDAHWARLHQQLESLPLRIVGAQIVVGLLIWVAFAIYIGFRSWNTL